MLLEHAGDTDIGRKRQANQDGFLVLPQEHLFVVADGMGGHQDGGVASQVALDAIRDFFASSRGEDPATWPHTAAHFNDPDALRLASSIEFAHRRVLEEARSQPARTRMGTTAVALLFARSHAYVAHVGDSRCYHVSGGRMGLLTTAHTLAEELRSRYQVSQDMEKKIAKLDHVVSRILGGPRGGEVTADLTMVLPQPGDLFLLCSDGLPLEVPDRDIARILQAAASPAEACAQLIDEANEQGGRDNITAVVVRYVDGTPPPEFEITKEDTREAVTEVTLPQFPGGK